VRIKRLQLVHVRAFEHMELDFTPGLNLLVGINGAGKSTILEALAICLSRILPGISASQSPPRAFGIEDIQGAAPYLDAELVIDVGGKEFRYLRHQQREPFVSGTPGAVAPRDRLRLERRRDRPGRLRERLRELQATPAAPDLDTYTPELGTLRATVRSAKDRPLGIYFSTTRSVIPGKVASSKRAVGGEAAAFADALASREMQLGELAAWMGAQELLRAEDPRAAKHLVALRRAASGFLPQCQNLRAEADPRPRLLVDKNGLALDARQLSDGERSLLALALDLARRLSQANPNAADPVKQGRAVVLIDELDLHLHPRWQRTVVERLTEVFPRCQFIATTHSPQIIAGVEPEQVVLLTASGPMRPDRSLGMDSNWILRNIMEADERPAEAAEALRAVEAAIQRSAFKQARARMAAARKNGLELSEWPILEARMKRLELLAR
jgi:energy-coupling factor transporter ATP-binding protein EcfA2